MLYVKVCWASICTHQWVRILLFQTSAVSPVDYFNFIKCSVLKYTSHIFQSRKKNILISSTSNIEKEIFLLVFSSTEKIISTIPQWHII